MSNEQNNQGGAAAELERSRNNSEGKYQVFDSNQRGDLPRLHEIIVAIYEDGREPEVKTYQLYSSDLKPCFMPQDHAYKFLLDPAFRVLNPKGQRVPSISKFDPSKPLTELKDNEIVVAYEELSRDALFKRVKLLPGGEAVPGNASITEMADFLTKWRKSLKGMTEGDRAIAQRVASGGQDTISPEGLDKLLGERKAA